MKRQVSSTEIARPHSSNEAGRVTLYALIGIGLIFFFATTGRTYVEAVDPNLYWGIIAVLAAITLFCIGCALHMAVLGEKSNRSLYKELLSKTRELEKFAQQSRERVQEYEDIMRERSSIISRKGTDCLSMLNKVLHALDVRVEEIRHLLASKDRLSLIDADELYRKRLVVIESCLDTLIDSDPIPPLAPYEWQPMITRLLNEIEGELKELELVA